MNLPNLGTRTRALAVADRAQALLEVALTPGGPRALIRQRPLSLSAFLLTSRLARLGLVPASLIDVGANTGQFTAAALYQWPHVHVHAFEPLPDESQRLKANFGSLDNVHTLNIAIGDRDGSATLHRHAHSLSSSILPATLGARNRFSWAVETTDVEVPMKRLDSIFSSDTLHTPALLKIDVQGFESQVLSGAQSILPLISAIVVEQSFEPFYDGQLPFSEAHADLVAAGWTMTRILSIRNEEGIPVEADCLYVPTTSPRPTMVQPRP